MKKLPDCQSLSYATSSCIGVGSDLSIVNKNSSTELLQETQINCTEPFFFSNGTCLPQCDKWKQYSDEKSSAIDLIAILSSLTSLVFGSIILVLSTIHRQKMFIFPAVIVVYMTINTTLFSSLILISFINPKMLFCSSENLIEAVKNPTPYCAFVGSMYYYSLLQLSVLWLCHVITVFLKIVFPFQAKLIQSRNKSIHVVVVLIGLGFPLITVIVSFATGGFIIDHFPPLLCISVSSEAAYYTLALPISVIIATGTSLLAFVMVTIIKHMRTAKRQSGQRGIPRIAEIKIFIVLCYYIIIGSVCLAAFTLNATTADNFIIKLYQYFACKSSGDQNLCNLERSAYELFTNPEIGSAAFIVLGFLPAVNLVYVVSCENVRQICCNSHQKSNFNSRTTSAISPNL